MIANKILGRSMAVAILAFFMQAAVPALADPSETGWQLVWSDEFDGDSLDTTKWNYEEDCWGGGNNERQCYTDKTENVSVKDGFEYHRAEKNLHEATLGLKAGEPARRHMARRFET